MLPNGDPPVAAKREVLVQQVPDRVVYSVLQALAALCFAVGPCSQAQAASTQNSEIFRDHHDTAAGQQTSPSQDTVLRHLALKPNGEHACSEAC